MHRNQFIKLTFLASLGIQYEIKNEFFKACSTQQVQIKNLLGLSASHLISDSILIEKQTYRSFLKMKSEAAKEGMEIQIVSGYRSFSHQKSIWERKFKQMTKQMSSEEAISNIITYSSIPGTSRHHWGTDIDVIDAAVKAPEGDLLLEQNYTGLGPYSPLKSWMEANSKKFGFHLVYTADEKRSGFNYEPWHYSYAPTSRKYLNLQVSNEFKLAWKKLEFTGKSDMSDEFIETYFKNYSLGINPTLMPS
ncbi:M15 family metallopeptidase [Psychroflexus tropicus]|uniref:M15 family metallopeptidase n=1 Tax=Psychroflexus tropicus TaxID=197345 RepID=UPI0003692279|nr:M15 family metallopeptidase [Psychroflexus tropicus]